MGAVSLTLGHRFHTLLILLAAVLVVFGQAAFHGLRHWLGAQPDLLPALMVYAAFTGTLGTVAALALVGGLGLDSLSANPLGISLLPLFTVGLMVHAHRGLILRDQRVAQFVLGLAASAAVPVLTLLLLLTAGYSPLLGWGTLWQWLVMSLGGGVATPAVFWLLDRAAQGLSYRRVSQPSFRPDREIHRGRF